MNTKVLALVIIALAAAPKDEVNSVREVATIVSNEIEAERLQKLAEYNDAVERFEIAEQKVHQAARAVIQARRDAATNAEQERIDATTDSLGSHTSEMDVTSSLSYIYPHLQAQQASPMDVLDSVKPIKEEFEIARREVLDRHREISLAEDAFFDFCGSNGLPITPMYSLHRD